MLADTATERDQILADAQGALEQRDELELELQLMDERNSQIFRQLEEAVAVSVTPLDKMFRSAGMPPDRILEQVRRGYSGQGGPLTAGDVHPRRGTQPRGAARQCHPG